MTWEDAMAWCRSLGWSEDAVMAVQREAPQIAFTVPGEPVAWRRPGRRFGRYFTRPEDALHREKVRAAARNAGIRTPLTGPVRLDAVFFVSRDPLDPKVGDEDNLRKLVKDALQGIAYRNDRQVVCGWTAKVQDSQDPRTEITVGPA